MLKLVSRRRVSALLAGLFTFCLPLAAQAAKISLETTDLPVGNSAGTERNAKVALANSNVFVVVYEAPDASGSGIFFKRYDSNWQLVQGPVAVNTFTTNNQQAPKVAMDPSGNFVIVWQSQGQDPGDSASQWGVYGRRYQADGTAIDAAEFRVTTTTTGDQLEPSVSINAVSYYVVAFRSGPAATGDIFAQVFDGITQGASGAPGKIGNEVVVNDTTASSNGQTAPVVALERFGAFYAVAYQSADQDNPGGGDFGIYIRRMSFGGGPSGPESLVNTVTAGNQQRPDIAIDPSGNYNVVWTSDNVDGSGTAVQMQRYNSSGVAQGGNIQVNTGITLNNQFNAHIASSGVGTFLVTWTGEEADGDNIGTDVYYKMYNSSGGVLIGDSLVSPTTATNDASEDNATAGVSVDSDFVVSFESGSAGNSDVYLRRFADAPSVTLSSTSSSLPESFNAALILFRNGRDYALANLTTVVTINRTGGTATPGTDFTTAFPAIATFAPGVSRVDFSLGIFDDGISEPDQTLELALGSITNGVLGDFTTHVRTIIDTSPPPSFVFSNTEITEGDSGTKTMAVTVALSQASERTITADYATSNLTATVADGDYVAASGSLTFAPGETSKTVPITINGDRRAENDEQFYLSFSNMTNVVGSSQTTPKILNDDPLPTVSISSVSRQEGSNPFVGNDYAFVVTLSEASSFGTSVSYATEDNTALADADYYAVSGTLYFSPGETSKTVIVPVFPDTVYEPDQTFYVNLSNPGLATIGTGQGVGTILNDDAMPSLTISDAQASESAGVMTFTVTRDHGSDLPVTVNYATSDDTAVSLGSGAGQPDYTATSGTLTFAPSVEDGATQTITVPLNNDMVYDVDRTFFVDLSNASGATIADSRAAGLIYNDESKPRLNIFGVSEAEGNSGTTAFDFTVTLDQVSALTTTVNYATADGTAIAGTDYTAVSGTLVFNPGVVSKTITVLVKGDTLYEDDQSFTVTLSSPTNADFSQRTATGSILNDDTKPTLSVNDVTVAESAGTATFTVTKTGTAENAITVDYTTVDDTARSGGDQIAGFDYVAASGQLTFAAGSVGTETRTITVPISEDDYYEPAEQFYLNLVNSNIATVIDGQGVATITDNDLPPTLSIADSSAQEGGDGGNTMTFTVTLTGNSSLPVSVDYATADGTAVANGSGLGEPDYAPTSGTLIFAEGEGTRTRTFTVPLYGDAIFEADKQFVVNLSNPTNNSPITDSQGVGTIINDDPEPGLSIGDVTQAEGDAGTTALTFTVTLSAPSGKTTTVNYATADGTAAAGSDYTVASGTLTFAPGVTTQTVAVVVTGDTVFEPDQTFLVNLSGATNATLEDAQGVGTITNDDAAPALTINDVTASEAAGTITFTVTRTGATEASASVDYTTADGTAVSTADGPGTPDYTATSGTLTFAPSLAATATQTFTVSLSDDSVYEAVEQFVVNLSNTNGATIADGQGVATITNDDSAPTLSIGDVTSNESAGSLTFTVTLMGATGLPIAVDYGTADGTAVSTAGATPGTPDYTAASGTLTFAASASSTQTQTFTVPLTDDSVLEDTEQLAVNLSNPSNGATISDGQGVATVTDDDTAPTLSIGDVALAEGNAGTTSLTFTVTLSAPSGKTTTVSYATADDTALAGSDYAAASGSLTFTPGETTKTLSVQVNGDTTVEVTEQFFVNLSSPTNATIADGQGLGTITSDDVPVVTAGSGVILRTASTLTINGSNFDPTAANNTVSFNLGAAGTVTEATPTSLTVAFSTTPTNSGSLTAVVTTNGVSSGAPVQVAVVNAEPIAQNDVAYVQKKLAVEIDVLANDSDSAGDTLTITGVSTPAHGTATIIENGQKIRYEVTEAKITPDSFTYTITDSYGATATANVSVSDQLPAQAGTYNGLIQPAGAAVGNAQIGLAKITINGATGKFTAVLKLAGQSFTATGVFGTDGTAKFGKTGTADFAMKRKGASELRLTLQVGLDALVDTIEGTLTDAGAPFAQLSADRALYTAKKNPVLPSQPVPTELLGKYTVRLAALTAPNQGHLAAEYPQGDGVGILTLSTGGVAKLTGTLADGTNFSYANSLSLGKRWPFYVPLVKGSGSVSGYVTFGEDLPSQSDLRGLGLQWYLPANSKAARYPQGWADGIATDLLGSLLVLPEVKSGASVLPGLNGPQPAGNASLHLSGGGLDVAGITQAFNVTGKASAVAIQPNPTKATLSVPRTGYFSGAFRFPDTNKPGKYKGIIFQNTAQGFGFFLGATESGAVSLGGQ